jgi:hypothetical protein
MSNLLLLALLDTAASRVERGGDRTRSVSL